MNKQLKIFWLVFICLLPTGLHARQRWFHIEIIVFKQYTKTNEVFEQTVSEINWPKRTVSVSSTQYPLSTLRQAPKSLASVQASDRLLNNSYARLRKNGNYQPLAHFSWIQAVGSNRISQAVRIRSGSVNGLIKIQRGNYIHLLTDIEFSPNQVIYHIQEKRRLKLNETHFFDHPKFGIIAKVSPL